MTRNGRISRGEWRVCLLTIAALTAQVVCAQETAAGPEPPPGALKAELSAPRHLYSPNRPVWVRFTLQNVSDQAIDIPLTMPRDADGTVALPVEIALGTSREPALFVTFQDEKPAAVQPPVAPEGTQPPETGLRLAPRASLGTELDLREFYTPLRYSGTYRVEWRPLGGRAGSGSAEFRIEPRKDAIIVTDKGKMTFNLAYDEAPRHIENFLDLVRSGFYDGKSIHRIIPGFLIQAGCPKGDGTGVRPDNKLIPAEFHNAPFQMGTLAMARKPSDPNSASCQFFVTLSRLPELDGQFTVIGQASDEESIRTLNQIAAEPTDKRSRPRLPLIIRSINLVDSEQAGTTRFDIKPVRPTAPALPSTARSGSIGP